MPRIDGSVNIDSKLDPRGMQEGMKKVVKAAVDGFKEAGQAAEGFEAIYKAMNLEEKTELWQGALAHVGDAFNRMTTGEQLSVMEQVFKAMHGISDESGEAAENVEKTAVATGRWSRNMLALKKIISAIAPGSYRFFRGAEGARMASAGITKAMGGAATASTQFALGLLVVVGILAVIIALAVALTAAFVLGLFAWAQKITNTLYRTLTVTSEFRDRVKALKTGFDNVKGSLQAMAGTLLMALAPVLTKIIDWLVKMVNFATMFIAAITGQKSYMKYVAGSATEAEKGTGGMADNVERANKAAEGALASFDQINVLAQEKGGAAGPAGGAGGMGGATQMEEVFLEGGELKTMWQNFKTWILTAIIIPIVGFFVDAGLKLRKAILKALVKIKIKWALFKLHLSQDWEALKKSGIDAWEGIKLKWAEAGVWFANNVSGPLKEKWGRFVANLETGWANAWTNISDFVLATINGIIDIINGLMAAIVAGLNTVFRGINKIRLRIPSWMGGGTVGFHIGMLDYEKIPHLAKGAVIPPNAPFAAILGEQRSGKNIEAPESLIRQIIQEEIGQIQGDFTFAFEGSMGALVRELKPHIDKENVRIGPSLVTRSTA